MWVPHFFRIATEAHNHPVYLFRRSILALSLFEAVSCGFNNIQFERRNYKCSIEESFSLIISML